MRYSLAVQHGLLTFDNEWFFELTSGWSTCCWSKRTQISELLALRLAKEIDVDIPKEFLSYEAKQHRKNLYQNAVKNLS